MQVPTPDHTRPTIGVVAISYNEEEDITGFLDCLLPWVDEIVIIDDGSTDETESIVRHHQQNARWISSPRGSNEGYNDQRNKGISAASSDWLLHMDVDERVTPVLAKEIRDAIRDTSLNAFRYYRRNYFLNRHMKAGGWNTWNHPQLARRGKHHFTAPVHEACLIDGGTCATGQLTEPMWHLNDDTYARLESELREEKGLGGQ